LRIFSLFLFFVGGMFCHTPFLENNIYNLSPINKIPKVIHQIWVGNKPIPKIYQKFMKSWKKNHPDWEYRLWTDKDVDLFPWINRDLFDAVDNPGMKSDIWRYEIIYRFGGVYVDCDMESRRPLDPMHSRMEFYASYLLMEQDNYEIMGCHLLAAPVLSIIMGDVVYALRKKTRKMDLRNVSFDEVQQITGPLFWTNMIRDRVQNDGNPRTVVFTPEYFHPTSCESHGKPKNAWELDNVKNKCFSTHTNGASWTDDDPDEICFDS